MKESHLIFGLMATFNKPYYTFGDIYHLTRPFDVSESSIRTILSRMVYRNEISTFRENKQVHYRFAEKGIKMNAIASLAFHPPTWENWDHRWWGVTFTIPDIKNEQRYRIRKKLQAYHFANLYPGFWIRPYHIEEKIDEKLKSWANRKDIKIIDFRFQDPLARDEIRKLWNIDKLNQQYETGLTIIGEARTNPCLSPERALVLKMEVGNEVVNLLFSDPLLPDEYLPANWKGNHLRKSFLKWDKEITKQSKPYWFEIFKT